jgi:hypothetical protein
MDTIIPSDGTTASVPVDRDTLKRAVERTGIADPTELVDFALRLLSEADPSADFARRARGTLPDLDLDV